jgi:acyl-coenzyme A synthetase/AMP-(fatty) acid ligase/acetyltransferase-like isoleucine patch superfamily enzyme
MELQKTRRRGSFQDSKEEAPILQSARHLLKPNGSILGREVAACILPQYSTFASAIPTELVERPALGSIDGRAAVTHARIQQFILTEYGPTLHKLGFGKGDRIALVLPNGPELALAIVATAHWASCVPLSANGAHSELEADLLRAGIDLVIGPYSGPVQHEPVNADPRFHVLSQSDNDWSVFASIEESAKRLGIPFVGLVASPSESGIFKLLQTGTNSPIRFVAEQPLKSLRDHHKNEHSTEPNAASDEVLVLFTSGTTGNKKIVPHQLGDMLTAATTIALSWALTPSDVNCNLMPLFHVGGIVRQVFSPLISGGCVICCPSFDPTIFWALLEKRAFSWYYAAPTMHQLILQSGRQEADNSTLTIEQKIKPELRMIANAAGGLLPSLAVQLQETFGANILPSYGMTECMPISSPPATYQLEKPGTSGVAVGPEIAILNTTTLKPLPFGEEGPICVRGEPCFRGYGTIANDPSQMVSETFLKEGWFNTGDLGCMDEDGYLFITGRSKEVINRGGEIISPMEVEEEVLSHPDVSSCAAFSALHDVLQEVVGIVLVMAPGRPRLDIPALHEYLGERLAAPKWPQCVVFMDNLPKSHTNKLLRVKLGSRLGLPELKDDMHPIERTFEAECPPQGTSLDVSIPAANVAVSAGDVQKQLCAALVISADQQLLVVLHPYRAGSLVCHILNVDRVLAIEVARDTLNRYDVPSHFVSLKQRVTSKKDLATPQKTDASASILQSLSSTGPADPLVQSVQEIYAELLNLDYLPGPSANFFHLGGSSMLASQLASKIRKRFKVRFSGAEVFHLTTCDDMANVIRQRNDDHAKETSTDAATESNSKSVDNHGAPFSASRLAPESSLSSSLFQLMPMFIMLPIWQVTRYLFFFALLLACIGHSPADRDIWIFVIAYIAFHLIWVTITPLVFVVIKWTVIGRYQRGRYPIWGNYYLRWWFVDICRKLFLRGIWGSSEASLNFYYRLLGAKIGRGARISLEADIAEFDLVTVGKDAAIEDATLRGFGVDNGAMILGPVSVGNNASLGAKSVVAPFTSVPHGCHLGPVTSSYDVGKEALHVKHARVNRRCLPQPNQCLQIIVGGPITFFVSCISQIPPLCVLFLMLRYKRREEELFSTLEDLMKWFCDPDRIIFFIGIRVARAILSPFFHMAAALLVKKCIIGKYEAGRRDTWSQRQLMHHWLSATLFSRKKIQDVTDIVGRHYELVSVLYRMLGAKVGKRVFWPGQQPVFSGEFDLLEVGDDVVFGSRSSIFFTTVDSCKKVILCAGSNVADNCVVLPGSIIGKNAVLGSNSVCPEDWYLREGSVWFGSKGCEPGCLERGVEVDLVSLSSEVSKKGVEVDLVGPILSSEVKTEKLQLTGDSSTLRPFGKAFYQGKSTYFVLRLWMIVALSVFIKVLIAGFHALPILASLHAAAAALYGAKIESRVYMDINYAYFTIYCHVLFMFFWAHLVHVGLWLIIELTAKWTLIGRRQPGRFNYDTSSYAQRWEFYQMIAKIRKFNRLSFLDFFSGTPFMASYFRWNGGTIGKDCCLYPAGADPFMPEPELVTIGDRCVIDCASMVCHLNTRGNFELAKITLENDCTLRTRSRLQQGCYMEQGSQLLEKSLAMTGEVLESYSVWQGGPASWWFQYSKKSVPYAGDDNEMYKESTKATKLLSGKASHYM